MTRAEILDTLKEVLISADENGREKAEKLTEDTALRTDLGLSSVNMLYMIIALEETLGIRFEGVGMGDFEKVGDVVSYIEGKV